MGLEKNTERETPSQNKWREHRRKDEQSRREVARKAEEGGRENNRKTIGEKIDKIRTRGNVGVQGIKIGEICCSFHKQSKSSKQTVSTVLY